MKYDRIKRLQDCTDGFISSSMLLKTEFENTPSITGIPPLAVNAAFAAELAMKRHIELATGNPVRGHELRELWDQIGSVEQNKLIPLICSPIPLDCNRFDEYLNKCSLTFVEWRYMYERESNFTNYNFLINLAKEVRKLK